MVFPAQVYNPSRQLAVLFCASGVSQSIPTVPSRLYSDPGQDITLLLLTGACYAIHALGTTLASNGMNQLLIHFEQTQALIALIANHAQFGLSSSLRRTATTNYSPSMDWEFPHSILFSRLLEFFDGLIHQDCLKFDDALSRCPPLDVMLVF
jgi:hypothetical protein